MATTIPVPIEFSLPEGWLSAPPDEVNAPEAAFVALHPPASKGFTPNITISGEVRGGDDPLTEIADEAVHKLEGVMGGDNVKLGRRNQVGNADNPGLTQAVRMSLTLNGEPQDIVQLQVFLAMEDVREESRRAVLRVTLSSLPEQFPQVVEDFQEFLSTIKPEQGGRQ